jgi:restriction system protein
MQVRRGRWDRKPVQLRHHDALSGIDWRDFERLIADYYREQGFEVQHDGTAGRGHAFDGGVDIRLRKDGKLTLVQCKHENAYQTEHNAVNELLGIKVNEGADEAIVITSGEFTAAAKKFGSQGHVRLIDGVELRRMLGPRLESLAPPAPNPIQAAAERFAWQAVEHVATRGRRRVSNTIEASIKLLIAKAALLLLFVLLLVFVALPMFQKALLSLATPPTHRVRQAPAASVVAPPPAMSPQVPAVDAPPPLPPSAEDLARAKREQAARDAEVQAYLERVPEVTHYRYSPLDQNREPQDASAQPQPSR